MNTRSVTGVRLAGMVSVFLFAALSFTACGGGGSGSATTTTLKELAEARRLRIGGFYDHALRSTTHDSVFEQEYNVMTAYLGWEGGVDHTSRDSYDFTTSADVIVDFGATRGMEIHGHPLAWFEDIPDWVDATPLSEIETVMNEHIDTVVGRYADRIELWDVVNEAIDDEGNIRLNNRWAEAMGADYISKAFIRARIADPTAVLRYNDYGMESNEVKYNGVKELLNNLLNNGVPVHALGWQMHVTPGSFDPTTLLVRMNEIADLGLDNYITELDVELPAEPTDADYEDQKQTYKMAVETFLAASRRKTIVFWGLRDGSPYWLTNNHPLPFDENYNKKPAYDGIQEALLGQ